MPVNAKNYEENFVDEAENVIIKLKERKDRGKTVPMVTVSKLRNLLSMTMDIYNEVLVWQGEILSEDIRARIEYLRVRFLYEAGRDPMGVKNLVEEAGIIEILKNINGSRKKFLQFVRYMEALVAFHRYYGGKD